MTNAGSQLNHKHVLNLGLNFALAPCNLSRTDTMAAVESGARRLSPEDAVATDVWDVETWKVPRSNLTRDRRTALKELRGLTSDSTSQQRECDW